MLVLAALILGGCSTGSDVRLKSTTSRHSLSPDLPTVIYTMSGQQNVDIYLTDMSRTELDTAMGLENITGHIIHIHMFLKPKAGHTPIDDTATNATVRHLIVASGVSGCYQGAGFLFPKRRPGSGTFRASIDDASVRLIRATPGFVDQLGPSEVDISFTAKRDDGEARLVGARFQQILASLPEAKQNTPAPMKPAQQKTEDEAPSDDDAGEPDA